METACQRASIGRTTHYDWLKKDKKYAKQVADIDEVAIDFGETQLIKLMKGYDLPDSKVFLVDHIELKSGKTLTTKKPLVVPITKHFGPDASSVIFFLKTRGKKRGYVEKTQVETENKVQALNAQVTIVPAVGGIPVATSEKEVDGV
ncbi:hypothetical protein [Hymenobacter metallicola]|uniref:hypothetical protein n=1 Tax=Hymenobacter metallicola TaxID=2563114 RepID=UPI0014368AB2|nr:hypothetical protein [Hymenobacter metallicola]